MVMEEKLNIANILKDKPKGTKLYADAFGELSLERVKANVANAADTIYVYVKNNTSILYIFYNDGKYNKYGEPILVPSKKMRDWNKFTWKTGDILVSDDGKSHVIFSRWYDDNYTSFYGKYYLNNENKDKAFYCALFVCTTEVYSLEDKDAAGVYISAIEEKLGGKLNLKTLKIEKTQLEFKDGDIVVTDAIYSECYSKCIFILKGDLHIDESCANSYVFYNISNNCVGFHISDSKIRYRNTHLATDEEKKQLFEALAKENKAWDAEKKKVIDLKPKWIPKPFDRVVTRVDDDAIWTANIFSHIDSYGEYNTIGCVGGYPYCLPYNKETAKLIGTTKEWKE